MCDTLVALGSGSRGAPTIFAKNSDRLMDEPQLVEWHPARDHERGAVLDCTYLTIPQASRTHAVVLGRPWWMWGAEMGVNEHSVAIGNQAVFAKSPPSETPALLGMDLVRLGLERSTSAAEALAVVVELLETHGQGGNCASPGPSYYDNSFIIADPRQAFVLETFGRHWMVEEVRDVRSISNLFTIAEPSRTSSGLTNWVEASGWSIGPDNNLSVAVGDAARLVTGPLRWARSTDLLRQGLGSSVPSMMRLLRDHASDDPNWRPCSARGQICAHADDSEPRGQTVGSLVAELGAEQAIIWVTASSAACLSIFKPVFPDMPAPGQSNDRFRAIETWWRHDRLHRALLADPSIDLAGLKQERDRLEAALRSRAGRVVGADFETRRQTIAECWLDAEALEASWAHLPQS
jgi:secernin